MKAPRKRRMKRRRPLKPIVLAAERERRIIRSHSKELGAEEAQVLAQTWPAGHTVLGAERLITKWQRGEG